MADKTDAQMFSQLSSEEKVTLQREVVRAYSSVQSRSSLAASLGKQFGGDRDLYGELGYTQRIRFEQYEGMYDRQDIAGRIIDLPADDTWRTNPVVMENGELDTEFTRDYNVLAEKIRLYHYLHRLDRLTGIGRYGAMLVGLRGQADLNAPAEQVSGIADVTFLATFDEGSADINRIESDPGNPRFGMVDKYQVTTGSSEGDTTGAIGTTSHVVDWSRVLHVAEGLSEDEVYGMPRLRRVFNRMFDLEKIVGGGAEAIWRLIYQGMVLTTQDGYRKGTEGGEETVLEDELNEFVHGVRRILEVEGFDVKFVGGEVVDPTGMFKIELGLISGESGIPQRLLVGSERGELASTTDQAVWAGAIESRRTNFAEPIILNPFVNMMVTLGVLPKHGILEWEWEPLFELTALEEAELAETAANALAKIAPPGAVDLIIDPEEFIKTLLPRLAGATRSEHGELDREDDELEEILADNSIGARVRRVRELLGVEGD